ncbi:MAG: right-handed parallel beta-helix repeat-containing protein [Candidatus Atribacteria bacterium]|nr:right-handed parallel beta-helix repeat-containing protein [Candidatus Atribacteria bacterium]
MVTFQGGETRQAILEGFTIRHGEGTMQYWPTAVLTYGGGIYIKDSSPNITFNVIRDNAAAECGGGIYITGVSSPRIVRNTIEDNYATDMGGGVFVDGSASPLMQQNTIKDNEAASLPGDYPVPPYGRGGGICVGMNASVRNIAGTAWPRLNSPPAGTESGGTWTYQNNTFSGNTHRGGRTDEGCHVYFASSP